MPEPFLATLIQTPSTVAWWSSIHASNSSLEANTSSSMAPRRYSGGSMCLRPITALLAALALLAVAPAASFAQTPTPTATASDLTGRRRGGAAVRRVEGGQGDLHRLQPRRRDRRLRPRAHRPAGGAGHDRGRLRPRLPGLPRGARGRPARRRLRRPRRRRPRRPRRPRTTSSTATRRRRRTPARCPIRTPAPTTAAARSRPTTARCRRTTAARSRRRGALPETGTEQPPATTAPTAVPPVAATTPAPSPTPAISSRARAPTH